MNTATNYAALYLADISKNQEELENDTREYPVSSVARFLWLYQLKKNNDPRFNEVAKQTGIFLHNPHWMEFQLDDLSISNENDLEDNLIISPEKTETSGQNETTLQPADIAIENAVVPIEENYQSELPIETFENESQPVNEQIPGNPVLENKSSVEEINEEAQQDEFMVQNESEAEIVSENQNDEELPQPVNKQISENPVLENQFSVNQNIERNKMEHPIVSNETEKENFTEKQKEEELYQAVNGQIPENPILRNEFPVDQNIEGNKNEELIVSNDTVEENKKLDEKNIEDEQKVDHISDEEEENENSVSFEPLHTVDYFASQGIKLNEEALNNDQLGKQVKSFTAWLKSMKKLHPGQLPEQNEVIEKLIQTSSEASNQSANVLTEAMAEVLVKQDKRDKAIEMYQKLSLLNPSKSAYFAAKIENLKIS